MTDHDLALLELAVYGQWDPHWSYFCTHGPVIWGAKAIDGVTVIALRGSVTAEDWWHDLQAFADTRDHDGLGPVHVGFSDHMEATWRDIQRYTSGPRIVIGHSLGAARAAILTGLMVLSGQPPLARVVWGEPLSGFRQLADLIGIVPARSYRNGDWRQHDPVTDLPVPTPHLPYFRAPGLVDMCVPPRRTWLGFLHRFPLIGWHDMKLYEKGTPERAAVE